MVIQNSRPSAFKIQTNIQDSNMNDNKIKRFEDLPIFQQSRELCKEIYRLTDIEPWKWDKRFVQQIRA